MDHTDEDRLLEDDHSHKVASHSEHIRVYKRRWYVLAVFCLISGTQGLFWNTWGPIADSAEKTFGWGDGTIALMANWGPIAYIPATPVFTWLMDVKGLRKVTVLSVFLMTLGAGLRCIPGSTLIRTILIHIGQLLNGIPGPLCMGASPLVSAVWFPVSQRTTATAIGSVFGGVGVTASFIIGPLMVQDLSNKTTINDSNLYTEEFFMQTSAHSHNETQNEEMLKEINMYMYISLGWCAFLFLLALAYFPNMPPSSPSITASLQRLDYKTGIKQLLVNRQFWTIGFVYGVSLGVYNCYMSVLEVLFKDKIPQEDTGWVGFYCGVAGNTVALIIARSADIFKRRMKLYISVLFIGATVCFTVCAVSYSGWLIPFTKVTVYITQILGSVCLTAVIPLFYELCCESTYPVAEGITNGLLTCLNNIAGLIFLLLLMIPNIGTSWMTWTVVGSCAVCVPFLLTLRTRYTRLDIDTSPVIPSLNA